MGQENRGWVIFADRLGAANQVDYELHWDCVRVFNHSDAKKILNHTDDASERKRIASWIFQGGTFEDAINATT